MEPELWKLGGMVNTGDMADWSLLRSALGRVDSSITFTWTELDALVGGLPPSATKHRAWWSGDRTHVNAWRSAGFSVANLVPGHEVTFVRSTRAAQSQLQAPRSDRTAVEAPPNPQPPDQSDILLITCVKEKLPNPAAAQDLYVSALFRKERAYAERSGLPWFILSAEHGLVAPTEWLAPYERYLSDTPTSFREAWGAWVVERLELLAGPLRGKVVEVHAGSAYVDAIRRPLAFKRAILVEPLRGLAMGQRLAWYGAGA